jgi:heme exporter protein B
MSAYWAILGKDLRLELRTRQTVISVVVFALLVLLVFNFSFELRDVDPVALAPGVLWATFVFNGVLVLERAFASERESGAMQALALAPIDRGLIFAAKWTLSIVLMLITEIVVLLAYALVFNHGALSPLLLLTMLLATVGFAAAGTVVAVVAFNSRAQEIMLPVLLLPLTVPLLIAAVRATAATLDGGSLRDVLPWLNLMGAFDVLVGTVCYYCFGMLLEE